ncbi:MAG: hypothetical protein JW795_07540 [Chitinivibrionales bacterium]|nr:hypothetical protein [Chitinivibrionales bacterium]
MTETHTPMQWNKEIAAEKIFRFAQLSQWQQEFLLNDLNSNFTPSRYNAQVTMARHAVENNHRNASILAHARQLYPCCMSHDSVAKKRFDLSRIAILLTAGGEGERLRLSLQASGYSEDQLTDFTKVTFPIPDFYKDFGTLHCNLCAIAALSRQYSCTIPVIISTGPASSVTASVIPKVLRSYGNFSLADCITLPQDERLHLTTTGQIAYTLVNGKPIVATNPDESGGPIMKLLQPMPGSSESALNWLARKGCDKLILLQASALSDPQVILWMAAAAQDYDGLGIGIERTEFPPNDPFGTFVTIEENGISRLLIVEQEIRNETTRSLINPQTKAYLPYNTGFYVFDLNLLQRAHLPDYATPPKEIGGGGIGKAPKIGYAATDSVGLAQKPAVLTIPASSFHLIKNVQDLKKISELARHLSLKSLCRRMTETTV